MQVTCHYRSDPERPLTDPVLELDGRRFVFRLYSGDICEPMNGNWFKEPYPSRVWRAFVKRPILPFIAWKWPLLKRSCYIGFKLYGFDCAEYRLWPAGVGPDDVYDGSQALCVTARPFASMVKQ